MITQRKVYRDGRVMVLDEGVWRPEFPRPTASQEHAVEVSKGGTFTFERGRTFSVDLGTDGEEE